MGKKEVCVLFCNFYMSQKLFQNKSWIKYKPKTIKLLEETTGKEFPVLKIDKKFLDLTPKAQFKRDKN